MSEFYPKEVTIVTANSSSFMVNSLKTSFESKNYKVTFLPVPEMEIHSLKTDRSIVFIFAEEYNELNLYLLSNIKTFINENNHKMIILGQPLEVDYVKRVLPASKILGEFNRPFDVKKLLEKTEEFIKIIQYEQIRKNILVVDDSGVMLRTINGWLSENYNVALANSATAADAALLKQKPDLILLDYEMPEVSGIDYLKSLRERWEYAAIPVIFLTSKGEGDIVKSVLELKPQGYILKTMSKDQIVQKIDNFFTELAKKHIQ